LSDRRPVGAGSETDNLPAPCLAGKVDTSLNTWDDTVDGRGGTIPVRDEIADEIQKRLGRPRRSRPRSTIREVHLSFAWRWQALRHGRRKMDVVDPLRYPDGHSAHLSRRRVLQYGAAAAALGAIGPWNAALGATARAKRVREAGALHYPGRRVGEFTGAFPFDHIVMVMQENHSFDNYFGMLPVSGQPKADGFTFNKREEPTNWNPLGDERMYVFPQAGAIGTQESGSQSWNDTHIQMAGGAMSGFATTGPGSMGYYTEDDLPFYYSLAKTFTVANHWFCSSPCQTYSNRRFLMAATSSGVIETSTSNVTVYPKNGTIWDQLSKHHISWANYFSDAPTTALILDTEFRHPTHLRRIEQFYLDAATGHLPAVSLVDCNMGAIQGEVPSIVGKLPAPIPTFASSPDTVVKTTCESEENPEDVQLGEAFVARVVNALMSGPKWDRTLMVWFYDEHGGYYDHVPPARVHAPDAQKPDLVAGDLPGDFRITGVRIPAVVVSPYARKHDVTNVVHDHTSVTATIEKQWNLPALSRRDANAATIEDFLDLRRPTFYDPPSLAKPANASKELLEGYLHGQPPPPSPAQTTPKGGTKAKE
jgi:phospholipase C